MALWKGPCLILWKKIRPGNLVTKIYWVLHSHNIRVIFLLSTQPVPVYFLYIVLDGVRGDPANREILRV